LNRPKPLEPSKSPPADAFDVASVLGAVLPRLGYAEKPNGAKQLKFGASKRSNVKRKRLWQHSWRL